MAIIQRILEKLSACRKTWYDLKNKSRNKIRFFWERKLQRAWMKFLESRASYTERLFYLFIALMSRITPVPFKMNLERSGESWCRPNLEPRSGFALLFIVMIQALFTSRCTIFTSVALTQNNFVLMQKGKFTPDSLVYSIFGLVFAGAGLLGGTTFIHRKELAQIFNSYVAFSEIYERKLYYKLLQGCWFAAKNRGNIYREIFWEEGHTEHAGARQAGLHHLPCTLSHMVFGPGSRGGNSYIFP